MGEDFILPACPGILLSGPIDVGDPNLLKIAEEFESECGAENADFFSSRVKGNETCAILAWSRYLIVGAVTFFPQIGLPPLIGKVYGTDEYPESWWRGLASDSTTLVVGCVTVAKGYRGLGIAKGLCKEMISWARKGNWRRLLVTGVNTELVGYNYRLALPFWEDLGFKIVRANNRSQLQPAWATKMKTEILKKHEMGEYLIEGIDFSILLKSMGWDGILASYDLELKIA